MERRQFLDALAVAAATGAGEEMYAAEGDGPGSLYIPQRHLISELPVIHEFMDAFGFVSLTTAPPIRVTHIPILLDRGEGRFGRLIGHLARGNPQKDALDGNHEAVVVFRGPHHYISPSWYAAPQAVPTWNFAVVHATGKPKLVEDAAAFGRSLERMVAKFEAYAGTSWDYSKLDEGYKRGTMRGAVMFEMPIDHLEAKFKLGLERSEADQEGVLKGLEASKTEISLLDLTRSRRAARKP